MTAVAFVIPIVAAGFWLISNLFAMWSPGRARRALNIAWLLAGLCILPCLFYVLRATQILTTSDPRAPLESGIFAAILTLPSLGSLLNVLVCWLAARREARKGQPGADDIGISQR